MDERTRVLYPDGPDWDLWVRHAPHDFYHLAAYHALAERAGEGRAAMVVHGSEARFLAWPYLIREAGEGYVDASSVYGYSGPVGRGLSDTAFRARAWDAVRSVWDGQGIVTLFTRFHPLLGNAELCRDFHGAEIPRGGEIVRPGRSVSIDLADDRETRRMTYRQKTRQDVKKAERAGLRVEHDVAWRHYPRLVELYQETMAHNTASTRYLFSDRYFDDLSRTLAGIAHLSVALVGDEVAAALVFTVHGDIAQAHLTGSDRTYAKFAPQKGILDGTADIARGLGARCFHIGAGRGGYEDDLFDFKSRFSPRRHDFQLGRWILDPEANAALSRERGVCGTEFFPAYRAPVPEAST